MTLPCLQNKDDIGDLKFQLLQPAGGTNSTASEIQGLCGTSEKTFPRSLHLGHAGLSLATADSSTPACHYQWLYEEFHFNCSGIKTPVTLL